MERLTGAIQNYAWGSTTRLAALRNEEPSSVPEAEIWYGAHPGASTTCDDGSSLLERINANAVDMLGHSIVERFGPRLPFLLKLLAADSPLSIQAHPSLEQAKRGFAAEEAAGIARDAFDRSFKDDNHKPELICALTPFEALVGFRSLEETAELFETLELGFIPPFDKQGPKEVIKFLLDADRFDEDDHGRWVEEIRKIVDHVVAAAAAYDGEKWADVCALIGRLVEKYPGDPGVIVATMLNYVILQPGEALYLGAGNLHAYVSGLAVEIMANSDNVLRGGLTPKHIDIPNLLDVVLPESMEPTLVAIDEDGRYLTPAPDFAMRCLNPGDSTEIVGPCIVLSTGGVVNVSQREQSIALKSTEACWLAVGERANVSLESGQAWLATVGPEFSLTPSA